MAMIPREKAFASEIAKNRGCSLVFCAAPVIYDIATTLLLSPETECRESTNLSAFPALLLTVRNES